MNYKIILASLIMLIVVSCGKHEKQDESLATFKVEAKPNITTLYYSGVIKPIQTYPINNIQAEGIVTQKGFEYGDKVNKGQLLLVITSQQLGKDYQSALRDYVRSKKELSDAQFLMTGADELKRLKMLSENEYTSTQKQLFNAMLDFTQSTLRLEEVLNQLGMPEAAVLKLDSAHPAAITEALSHAPNRVTMMAPVTGIALLPEESGSKDNAGSVNLTVGAQVKAGQGLLQIGDMSGISVTVKVTEVYVEQIKNGQKAIVTGDAFKGISLQGMVSHVDRQASGDTSGGGTPSFTVKVIVPTLSAAEFDKIRVGMSANIEFPISTAPQIKVPLSAVYTNQDQSIVKKIDKKTGKITDVSVETGVTGVDTVEVIKGLKDGDEVLVNATATH